MYLFNDPFKRKATNDIQTTVVVIWCLMSGVPIDHLQTHTKILRVGIWCLILKTLIIRDVKSSTRLESFC